MRIVADTRTAATAKAVVRGLVAYNTEHAGKSKWKRFSLSVRDKKGEIKGGIVYQVMWNWCFIELLWLDEKSRKKGHGRKLIGKAEAIAKKHGAKHVYVDTFTFQGDGFYQKLGYEVYGDLDDFPPGHRRLWLKKDLK